MVARNETEPWNEERGSGTTQRFHVFVIGVSSCFVLPCFVPGCHTSNFKIATAAMRPRNDTKNGRFSVENLPVLFPKCLKSVAERHRHSSPLGRYGTRSKAAFRRAAWRCRASSGCCAQLFRTLSAAHGLRRAFDCQTAAAEADHQAEPSGRHGRRADRAGIFHPEAAIAQPTDRKHEREQEQHR